MEQFSGWEWFYLDDEAQNVGPFTTEELVEFYAAQGITDDTYGTRLCKAFFLSLSFFVLTVFLPQRVVLYLHFFFQSGPKNPKRGKPLLFPTPSKLFYKQE